MPDTRPAQSYRPGTVSGHRAKLAAKEAQAKAEADAEKEDESTE